MTAEKPSETGRRARRQTDALIASLTGEQLRTLKALLPDLHDAVGRLKRRQRNESIESLLAFPPEQRDEILDRLIRVSEELRGLRLESGDRRNPPLQGRPPYGASGRAEG